MSSPVSVLYVPPTAGVARTVILTRAPVCACVSDSQTFLDDIKNQISSVTSQIPLETLSEVSSRIEKLQGDITTYTPHVTSIESIR